MGERGAALWERGSEPVVQGVPLLGVTVGYVFDTQCNKIIQLPNFRKVAM